MSSENELAANVAKIPDLDESGKFTGPEWDAASAVCEDVLKNTRENVAGLVGMLVEHKAGAEIADHKPRYLLHALAVHVRRSGDADKRRELVGAMASTLDGDRPAEVKGFVVRQIQTAGG